MMNQAVRIPTTDSRGVRSGRAGFTLLEGLIASAILAGAVVAAASAMSACFAQTQTATEQAQAIELAGALIEQISAYPLRDPDATDNETTFATFDDVGDFAGYTDTTAAGIDAMRSIDGSVLSLPHAPEMTRRVGVEFRQQPDGARDDGGRLAMVTVVVTRPGMPTVVIRRLLTATQPVY